LPSGRLFAIGPLTRAAFWEIIAIPDIRNQCAELAERLVRNAATVPTPPIARRAPVPIDAPTERMRLIGHQ
jgi:uncharacterized NAD(P)/FAD-binding protein YdhS